MTESNPCAIWDFRVSRGDLSSDRVIDELKGIAKQYAFQLERGDGGYEHYQGRISLIKKRRADQKHILLALFKTWQPNYLAPTCSAVSLKGDLFYVMKDDTRIEGPWTDVTAPKEIYIPRQYRNIDLEQLYPFQQTIWNTIKDDNLFNSRCINLVYCERGNKGKSTIAHLARLKHRALVIPGIVNDAKELIQTACNMCLDQDLRNPSAVFVDLPRAINKERLFGLYSAIEVIKDGYLYDLRNHFKSWDIDSPHVWVFTNSLPNLDMLSLDRWNVWTINDENALVEYADECVL